jgi:5-(carboxyamino)imidazole ribonucleotide synthase
MILPGATLGLVGGGQLGRMFTMAARTLDYRVMVLDPDPLSPAADIANEHLCADYHDAKALARLAAECPAITTEFENPPAESLRWLEAHCLVRPSGESVAIAQDRIREKTFLAHHGFPVGPFAVIRGLDDLSSAAAKLNLPAILKVSRFGYDGKGQARVHTMEEAHNRFREWKQAACVLEEALPLELEISVVLTRGADSESVCFPVAENEHRNGILALSIVPARVDRALALQAQEMAADIAEKLDYCGVLAVEFFLASGRLLVNEIAPRPHNSGHYTLDACLTSQFEQQVRALCALPLGDARLVNPAVMVNLLGDIWARGAPDWSKVLRHSNVKLHLYGKREARPGRKMGHYTVIADSTDEALALALRIARTLP